MKRSKQNKKRSTVVALVVAVACIAALIGATFAWFTDTASTATNKIQAGNLDVDLVMDKAGNGTYTSIADASQVVFGTENSLVAQNDNQDTVWEPGKTQIAYLGVKNAGNLALKYTIELTVTDNGLADALEYAFIEGAKASDMSAVTDWSTLKAKATQNGSVTAGAIQAAPNGLLDEIVNGTQDETDYFVLAIHMKEDAGNSYKSKSADIDVTIKATQVEGEYDSFSNTYDEQAKYFDNCLTFSSSAEFKLGTATKVIKKVEVKAVEWSDTETSYLQYSTDRYTWKKWDGSDITAVQSDNKYYVYLRGNGLNSLYGANHKNTGTNFSITSTKSGQTVDCSGNIMTLLDYDNPRGVTIGQYAFSDLFNGCTSLSSTPALPATVLAPGCYSKMFYGCTSLTTAPVLPATTLATYCYFSMFSGCTSLTTAPVLPATTLATYCYNTMFSGCTSLTTAPTLPATTLVGHCYYGMFQGCTSLTSPPTLPATKLEVCCYCYMFKNCSSLRVTDEAKDEATKIFAYPLGGSSEPVVTNMFVGTVGAFAGTPTKGTTYYWYTEE